MSDANPNENLILNMEQQKQFEKPVFRSNDPETDEFERLKEVDNRIDRVVASAEKKDTLGRRLQGYFRKVANKSSWLLRQTIPEQDEIKKEIDNATKDFELKSLSDSQKTKRGEKFRKKAEQQASMIKLMQKCHWQRSDALEDLMEHGRNARIGKDVSRLPDGVTDAEGKNETVYSDPAEKDTFLKNVGDDIDDVSVMMRDVSFYFEQKREDIEKINKKKLSEIHSFHYEPVELIADPETRNEGYTRVLSEFEKLDLTKFEYKDNDDFMRISYDFQKNDWNNSFVERFAELRAFSHADKMLDAVGDMPYGKEKYLKLYTKAALVKDILKDYKHRAMLIQSPYYVLLAGKDFDSISDEDLDIRINSTGDDLAKEYLKSIRQQRKKDVFKKGSRIKDLYKKKEKETIKHLEVRPAVLSAKQYNDMADEFEEITPDVINSVYKTRHDKKKQNNTENPALTTEEQTFKENRDLYTEYKESKRERIRKAKEIDRNRNIKKELHNTTYVYEKKTVEELKTTSSIGEAQENKVRSFEESLRHHYKDGYRLIDAKRSSDNIEERKAALFHSEGTRLLEEEGHDVLEIDVGGSGYTQFQRAYNGFEGTAAGSGKVDDYDLRMQYGDRYYSEKSKKTIKNIRSRFEEGVSEEAKDKIKYRYTIAGPTPELIYKPGVANLGEYSIENTIERILEIGQLHLERIFNKWKEEDKKAKHDPDYEKPARKADIMLRGHSRGGVGVSLGAMKLNYWLHKKYPQYADDVVFHLLQLDPVPGKLSDYWGFDVVDHKADSHLVKYLTTSNDPEFKPLGENAETTVVYSINTQYGGSLFTPQSVQHAKRIIVTPFNHSVGQPEEEKDMTQAGINDNKAHAMSFYDAATGNAYRQSGLDKLDDGVYVMDEKHVLMRINSLDEYIVIMMDTVPKSELNDQIERQISLAKAIGSKFGVSPKNAEARVRHAIKNL